MTKKLIIYNKPWYLLNSYPNLWDPLHFWLFLTLIHLLGCVPERYCKKITTFGPCYLAMFGYYTIFYFLTMVTKFSNWSPLSLIFASRVEYGSILWGGKPSYFCYIWSTNHCWVYDTLTPNHVRVPYRSWGYHPWPKQQNTTTHGYATVLCRHNPETWRPPQVYSRLPSKQWSNVYKP